MHPVILTISILTILYFFLVGIFIFFFLNNLKFWRSSNYTIPYGLEEGTQQRKELRDPRIVYWRCENPRQKNPDDWAVLLHSFGRNSARMISRAKVYWEMGYSLIFIDARSHGQSQRTLTSHGFTFAEDLERVMNEEKLKLPVIHGLSVGAIAGVIYSSRHPVRAYIGEALVSNYWDMVVDTITIARLPKFLFMWVARLLLSFNLPFEEYRPSRLLKMIDAPIFLIHGENDRWFTVERHLLPNLQSLEGRDVSYWIVPGSSHSKMAMHPEYEDRLREFLLTKVKKSNVEIKSAKSELN